MYILIYSLKFKNKIITEHRMFPTINDLIEAKFHLSDKYFDFHAYELLHLENKIEDEPLYKKLQKEKNLNEAICNYINEIGSFEKIKKEFYNQLQAHNSKTYLLSHVEVVYYSNEIERIQKEIDELHSKLKFNRELLASLIKND